MARITQERESYAKKESVDEKVTGLIKEREARLGQLKAQMEGGDAALAKATDANAQRILHLEVALAAIGGRFAAATVGLTIAIFVVSILVSVALRFIR